MIETLVSLEIELLLNSKNEFNESFKRNIRTHFMNLTVEREQ